MALFRSGDLTLPRVHAGAQPLTKSGCQGRAVVSERNKSGEMVPWGFPQQRSGESRLARSWPRFSLLSGGDNKSLSPRAGVRINCVGKLWQNVLRSVPTTREHS